MMIVTIIFSNFETAKFDKLTTHEISAQGTLPISDSTYIVPIDGYFPAQNQYDPIAN
jgi:hypothetical protein